MRAVVRSPLPAALLLLGALGCAATVVPPTREARLGGTGRAQADRPSTDEGGHPLSPSPLSDAVPTSPSSSVRADDPLAGTTRPADIPDPGLAPYLDFLILHRVKIPRFVLIRLVTVAPDSAATQLVLAAARAIALSRLSGGDRFIKQPRAVARNLLRLALPVDSAIPGLAPSPILAAPAPDLGPRTP